MNTKKEILDFLKQNQKLLLETYHITRIGLFGSFAREEQKESSDVDILIDIQDGTKNIHDLKLSLKKYLSNAFGRNVDLAREKYLKPYAKKHILKDILYV
ncbi:MAG: nucleotidyltransferase family protein [Campylobacteraceae bacterium]|nr:nucleotidyltransferase family protein [Campylobacteraceae bacterium]